VSFFAWPAYVSVAERRRRAERKLAQLRKKGEPVAPVRIEGRVIAASFWGKSWCQNLERYSDYATRLPRGRSYVRNGSVLDLQIAPGRVAAMVAGSDLYKVKVTIEPVTRPRWKSICRDCAGGIDSLIELLQGRLAKGVMDRVCREGDGLFPAPGEIKLSCSCPDWADMCKHVAAVLYGVGARLDEAPRLLFVLRGVDESELLANAGSTLPLKTPGRSGAKVLDGINVAGLFGLEMADPPDPAAAAAKPTRRTKAASPRATNARKKPGATRKPRRRARRARSGEDTPNASISMSAGGSRRG
jgi:uncharacterized Zn finger protein